MFGQLLGYGSFRFESAGQEQALREITFMPDANEVYREVSGLLFSGDWGGAASGGRGQPRAPAAAPASSPGRGRRAPSIPGRPPAGAAGRGGPAGDAAAVGQAGRRCGSTCTPTPRCPTAPRPRPNCCATARSGRARRRGPHRPRHHRRLGGRRGRPPAGLTVVPGMELSCRWFPDDRPPISVHLLAYLFDPAHPGFAAERARLAEERLERGERSRRRAAPSTLPGGWRRMVDRGGVVDPPQSRHSWRPAASSRSMPPSPRCCTTAAPTTWPWSTPTSVRGSRWSVRPGRSGVRPRARHQAGRVVGDDAIAAMVEAGLLGLQVDHPDHSTARARPPARTSDDLGLIVTGSSDYHGSNKQTRSAPAPPRPTSSRRCWPPAPERALPGLTGIVGTAG